MAWMTLWRSISGKDFVLWMHLIHAKVRSYIPFQNNVHVLYSRALWEILRT